MGLENPVVFNLELETFPLNSARRKRILSYNQRQSFYTREAEPRMAISSGIHKEQG